MNFIESRIYLLYKYVYNCQREYAYSRNNQPKAHLWFERLCAQVIRYHCVRQVRIKRKSSEHTKFIDAFKWLMPACEKCISIIAWNANESHHAFDFFSGLTVIVAFVALVLLFILFRLVTLFANLLFVWRYSLIKCGSFFEESLCIASFYNFYFSMRQFKNLIYLDKM